MENIFTPTKPKPTHNQLFASFLYAAAGVATIWMVVGHVSDLAPISNNWHFGLPLLTATAFIMARHVVPLLIGAAVFLIGVVGIAVSMLVSLIWMLLSFVFVTPFKAVANTKRKRYAAA